MFLHETKRNATASNVAAVLLGLLVGFPYLLFTMHFYVKPPRTRTKTTDPSLQDRVNALK